jgi:hypothetical protein
VTENKAGSHDVNISGQTFQNSAFAVGDGSAASVHATGSLDAGLPLGLARHSTDELLAAVERLIAQGDSTSQTVVAREDVRGLQRVLQDEQPDRHVVRTLFQRITAGLGGVAALGTAVAALKGAVETLLA